MESRERAETAAAAWLARREGDEWSVSDEAEFDAWIHASIDNRVAWLRLKSAWQQTSRLKSLVTSAAVGAVPAPDQAHLPFFDSRSEDRKGGMSDSPSVLPQSASGGKGRLVRAVAASVLIALAIGIPWQFVPRGPSYRTAVGVLQAVPLVDGSRVTLNTNTQIRVDVTETERRVNLERGEAYFEVSKDPLRPFVVKAGDKRIIAVGTRFSVRRENDEVRVFVTEGKVRVEQAGQGDVAAPVRPDGESVATLLMAGSVARANADSVLVQERSIAEVEQLLSWRTGYLAFDKTPLADAVAEFNRYNTRQIIIEDPAVATIRVGGSFRATNADGFVRLIASDFPITVTQRGSEVVLSGMPPP